MNNPKRLLLIVNDADFFLSHRLPIAKAAQKAGFQVHVASTGNSKAQQEIETFGFHFHTLSFTRRGINPLIEVKTIFSLWRLFRKVRPSVTHLVTIKPVLYGGLAARFANLPAVVSALTGLGYVHVARSKKGRLLRSLVRPMYKIALDNDRMRVIFQNPEDRMTLLNMKVVRSEQTVLIRGSGVDTDQYSPVPEHNVTPVVLLASRMLWDKGVGEFVAAATELSRCGVNARFVLAGDSDSGNPAAVPIKQLEDWQRQGIVEWWGKVSDMPKIFSQSHIVCLPSKYGEGVPKVLIEAAACGRPIVTTNSPGCREIVRDGINGLLVPVNDVSALASALQRLIENKELRLSMGQQGRMIAITEFHVAKVVEETLDVYRSLLERVS